VAFDALLRDGQISEACIVHHMGHAGERSRGDSRLRDWPDAEWRMMRESDDPASARYITAYGRDVNIPESRLSFDAETRRLMIAGGSRQDNKLERPLAKVLDVLRTGVGDGQSQRAIVDACIGRVRQTNHRGRNSVRHPCRKNFNVSGPTTSTSSSTDGTSAQCAATAQFQFCTVGK